MGRVGKRRRRRRACLDGLGCGRWGLCRFECCFLATHLLVERVSGWGRCPVVHELVRWIESRRDLKPTTARSSFFSSSSISSASTFLLFLAPPVAFATAPPFFLPGFPAFFFGPAAPSLGVPPSDWFLFAGAFLLPFFTALATPLCPPTPTTGAAAWGAGVTDVEA